MITYRDPEDGKCIFAEATLKVVLRLDTNKYSDLDSATGCLEDEVSKLITASISEEKKDPNWAHKQIVARNMLITDFLEDLDFTPISCVIDGATIKELAILQEPELIGNARFNDVKVNM